jgi:chaperonin GroES
VKAEAKTASGIYIPEKNVEKLNEADVLAVGPGVVDKSGNKIPVSVQSGDRVLIPPYGGSSIKIGDEDLLLFRDNEILAKVSKE